LDSFSTKLSYNSGLWSLLSIVGSGCPVYRLEDRAEARAGERQTTVIDFLRRAACMGAMTMRPEAVIEVNPGPDSLRHCPISADQLKVPQQCGFTICTEYLFWLVSNTTYRKFRRAWMLKGFGMKNTLCLLISGLLVGGCSGSMEPQEYGNQSHVNQTSHPESKSEARRNAGEQRPDGIDANSYAKSCLQYAYTAKLDKQATNSDSTATDTTYAGGDLTSPEAWAAFEDEISKIPVKLGGEDTAAKFADVAMFHLCIISAHDQAISPDQIVSAMKSIVAAAVKIAQLRSQVGFCQPNVAVETGGGSSKTSASANCAMPVQKRTPSEARQAKPSGEQDSDADAIENQ